MISINNLTILYSEIIRSNSNLGFSRSKITASNEEYSLGKNKNLFQINIRNKSPLFKISIELLLERDKLLLLEKLYNDQQSNKLYNFKIDSDDVGTAILYNYVNPTTNKIKCFIETFELLDSLILNNSLKYRCKLDIIEI